MGSMEWLLAAEWTAYGALHSILASTAVKKQLRRWMGKGYRFFRLIYSTLALLLLIPMIQILLFHPSPYLWEPGPILKIVGICISFMGLLLAAYVLRRYLRSTEGFRDLFMEGETPALQTNGLHRWVRHLCICLLSSCCGGLSFTSPLSPCWSPTSLLPFIPWWLFASKKKNCWYCMGRLIRNISKKFRQSFPDGRFRAATCMILLIVSPAHSLSLYTVENAEYGYQDVLCRVRKTALCNSRH